MEHIDIGPIVFLKVITKNENEGNNYMQLHLVCLFVNCYIQRYFVLVLMFRQLSS